MLMAAFLPRAKLTDTLNADTSVTSQDIFDDRAIGLVTEDLDTLKTPGIYFQPANSNTSAARHYPENNAGTLVIYKNAGVTQVYRVYNSSRATRAVSIQQAHGHRGRLMMFFR